MRTYNKGHMCLTLHVILKKKQTNSTIIHSHNPCGRKHNIHFTDNGAISLHQNVNFRNIIQVCNLFIIPTYASSESYEHTLSNNQERDRKTDTDKWFFVCWVGCS